MSEQTQALAPTQGPFSPERYDKTDASMIGLPSAEALNLLMTFSKQLVGTPFIPKGIANGGNVAGNILAVVLTGREEGYAPMESLRSYWISPDGRLAKYADALMAKMRRHGFKFPEKEFTAERAHLKAIRPDGEDFTSTLNMQEVPSTLRGKQIWKDWPQRMLKARVIGDVYRFLAADLGGPDYAAEELMDLENADNPNSTTAEASQSDLDRVDALSQKYNVGLKTQATPTPEAAPVVVDVKPEPKPEPQAASATAASAANTTAEPAAVTFAVYRRYQTGNKAPKDLPFPVDISDSTNRELVLKAATLSANEANSTMVLMRVEADQITVDTVVEPEKQATTVVSSPVAASTDTGAGSATKARFEAVVKDVAAKLGIAERTSAQRVQAWMCGFSGLSTKEFKDADVTGVKLPALGAMEACIAYDINEFASPSPEESGKRHARHLADIGQYLTAKWPNGQETVLLGMRLSQVWNHTAMQFQQWFEKVMPSQPDDREDVHAAFRLLLKTREAVTLIKLAQGHNLSLGGDGGVVDQIEKRAIMAKIEDAPQEQVERAIQAYCDAVKSETKAETPPAAPAPEPQQSDAAEPPAEGSEDVANLFGEDW
jgi:hypothetical protein